MPNKSRRSRAKRSYQDRKNKGGLSSPTPVAQQPAATQSPEPVAPSRVAVPSARVSSSVAASAVVHHPFIVTELRRIGILAGIALVILIVLSLILS